MGKTFFAALLQVPHSCWLRSRMAKGATECADVSKKVRAKLSKEEKAAIKKDIKERKSQAKLEKLVDKSLLNQIASHAGISVDEAALVLVRAGQGDLASSSIV